MSKRIIHKSFLTAMGDKIRIVENSADLIPAIEMAGRIGELPTSEGLYAWKRMTADGTFVAYVTSDDETEYPESGVGSDGYIYEKIKSVVIEYVWNQYRKDTTTTTKNGTLTATVRSAYYIDITLSGGVTTWSMSDLDGLTFYFLFNGELPMYLEIYSDYRYYSYSPVLGELANSTYTVSGNTLTLKGGVSNFNGQSTSKSITNTITSSAMTLLGEVTSNSRDTYPDTISSIHTDGYYYEYVGEREK